MLSIKNLISIDFRREVVEGSMKDAPTSTVGDILVNLSSVFGDSHATTEIDHTVDE